MRRVVKIDLLHRINSIDLATDAPDKLWLLIIAGHGIEETNAGIGIPASRILVWYRTKKMPDCVSLVRYRTCSGIVSFFQSGTGLTGCRRVRHSSI